MLFFGLLALVFLILWIVFGVVALATGSELYLDLSLIFIMLGLLSLIFTGFYA